MTYMPLNQKMDKERSTPFTQWSTTRLQKQGSQEICRQIDGNLKKKSF